MSLLRLPPELIQHVLLMLDPASFYLCLQTSKLLRENALHSRNLVLHQVVSNVLSQLLLFYRTLLLLPSYANIVDIRPVSQKWTGMIHSTHPCERNLS